MDSDHFHIILCALKSPLSMYGWGSCWTRWSRAVPHRLGEGKVTWLWVALKCLNYCTFEFEFEDVKVCCGCSSALLWELLQLCLHWWSLFCGVCSILIEMFVKVWVCYEQLGFEILVVLILYCLYSSLVFS